MKIQASQRREIENVPPQDLAEGDNNDHLWLHRAQERLGLGRAQRGRLKDRDSHFQCRLLHRRRLNPPPAARRPIRRRDHGGQLEASRDQRAERRHGEIGRPHKDDAHHQARLWKIRLIAWPTCRRTNSRRRRRWASAPSTRASDGDGITDQRYRKSRTAATTTAAIGTPKIAPASPACFTPTSRARKTSRGCRPTLSAMTFGAMIFITSTWSPAIASR